MPCSTRALLCLLLIALPGCGPGTAARPAAAPRAQLAGWMVPALPAPAPISAAEYAQRRRALVATMGDGVLVALGSQAPSADYVQFFQNSPFRYLTGITEPGAALVISKTRGRVEEQLFVLPRLPAQEVWEGPRFGAERARQLSGIPTRTADRLFPAVDSLLRQSRTMYTVFPGTGDETETADSTRDQRMLMRLATQHAARVIPVDETLNRLRGTKSAAELDLIRRAVYITNIAQGEAMRSMEPGMNEFEIQALIEYVFRRHGAERPSFATIVGSGPNSTTLHYNTNDRFMQAGDMVVMDIGASYRGYAADVTRSVPVNGVFSPEQRAIYSIVLDAQKAAEALARPGATMEQLNAAASRVLATGLARLGLIESASATYACGGAGALGRCPQLRLFYMHGLGHGIGLDVHDPNNSPFVVGSAFTIEPGIYVRADALDYLPDTPENRALIGRLRRMVERYRNIGVRIEDDYFITASGAERISAGAPREIGEIEALMAQTGLGNRERRPEVVEWYRAFGNR
ncbi:aminopeptidase P N-terminal domain-containing protein [soil metagenome]